MVQTRTQTALARSIKASNERPLQLSLQRGTQDSLARDDKSYMTFEALPVELQLCVAELLAYKELKSLAMSSRAMQTLVATSTPKLNATLFRSKVLPPQQLELCAGFRLHPSMWDLKIYLDTSWDDIGLGSSISEENATHPAASKIYFDVWNGANTPYFIETLEWDGRFDRSLQPPECLEIGEGTEYVLIENADGIPITLGQLVKAFCAVSRALGYDFEDYGVPNRAARFVGCWEEGGFDDEGCLLLDNAMWQW